MIVATLPEPTVLPPSRLDTDSYVVILVDSIRHFYFSKFLEPKWNHVLLYLPTINIQINCTRHMPCKIATAFAESLCIIFGG